MRNYLIQCGSCNKLYDQIPILCDECNSKDKWKEVSVVDMLNLLGDLTNRFGASIQKLEEKVEQLREEE